MKELKVGDKVLVPMEIISKRDGGDFPYTIGYDTARINMSEKRMAELQTVAHVRKAYEEGQSDAWKTARKLIAEKEEGGLEGREITQIFGKNYCDGYGAIFDDFTALEAAKKIAEWESKKEIHVGDILEEKYTGKKVVVSCIESRNAKNIYVIYPDGSCGESEADDFKKTGSTICIEALLAKIGWTEDA